MFPSKFLQFPSILTHFHAANEKIQNGGRDLAISRGLVWVKNATLNSSPPSAAYMRRWNGSTLGQIIACCLFGVKPLSKSMLIYCQLNHSEQTSVSKKKLESKNFSLRKISSWGIWVNLWVYATVTMTLTICSAKAINLKIYTSKT